MIYISFSNVSNSTTTKPASFVDFPLIVLCLNIPDLAQLRYGYEVKSYLFGQWQKSQKKKSNFMAIFETTALLRRFMGKLALRDKEALQGLVLLSQK